MWHTSESEWEAQLWLDGGPVDGTATQTDVDELNAATQLAQEKKYQVSPNGALLRDVLVGMETIALAGGYGPLEGVAAVSQIMHERPIGVLEGYTRGDVENVLKLALGAGFVYEV